MSNKNRRVYKSMTDGNVNMRPGNLSRLPDESFSRSFIKMAEKNRNTYKSHKNHYFTLSPRYDLRECRALCSFSGGFLDERI